MGHLRKKYTEDFYNQNLSGMEESGHLFPSSFVCSLYNKEILEIGFGRGGLVPFLIKEGISSYHGIDFSKDAFRLASSSIQDPKVHFQCMDINEVEVLREYDGVIMNHVLEHIPVFEMNRIWEKIYDSLKPGGWIFVKTPIFESPNLADHYDKDLETMGIGCHKQTIGSLLRTCLEKGFVIAQKEGNCFLLVKRSDLNLFAYREKGIFLTCFKELLSKHGLEFKDQYNQKELRSLLPDGGRLVIGCVTENFPPYRDQALRLVKSIRWFGGKAAGANIFVCVVDHVDQALVDELERWGVFVRVVKKYSKTHNPSNKLRLFELQEIYSYDTVMLLDCDTIMVQDPSSYITGKHFQAGIVSANKVPKFKFKRVFSHFNLRLPSRKHRTSLTRQPTILYCNAGVLIFPTGILKKFYPTWDKYNRSLDEKKSLLLGNKHFFCEQVSLSLALAAERLPFKKLPIKMNFPHTNTFLRHLAQCDPVIIHYHRRTKNGYISPYSPSQAARNRIRKFNNMLKSYLKK